MIYPQRLSMTTLKMNALLDKVKDFPKEQVPSAALVLEYEATKKFLKYLNAYTQRPDVVHVLHKCSGIDEIDRALEEDTGFREQHRLYLLALDQLDAYRDSDPLRFV